MKKLKIRFVAICPLERDRAEHFEIQIKRWYGWRYLGHIVDYGLASGYERYYKKTKQELIDYVIEHYYKKTKQYIQITEYPELRKY